MTIPDEPQYFGAAGGNTPGGEPGEYTPPFVPADPDEPITRAIRALAENHLRRYDEEFDADHLSVEDFMSSARDDVHTLAAAGLLADPALRAEVRSPGIRALTDTMSTPTRAALAITTSATASPAATTPTSADAAATTSTPTQHPLATRTGPGSSGQRPGRTLTRRTTVATEPDRCDLTDLLRDQCAHCLGHRSIEEQATTDLAAEHLAFMRAHRGWFAARYPGRCATCGEAFDLGVPVQMNPDIGWRAYCCRDKP